mmetsp:Transcript_9123/g.19649  ORF Transcript_9123/g.19649 Transcript_9123/m.19649 type:complete len:93 (-) Transcript_9123:383-661(-)
MCSLDANVVPRAFQDMENKTLQLQWKVQHLSQCPVPCEIDVVPCTSIRLSASPAQKVSADTSPTWKRLTQHALSAPTLFPGPASEIAGCSSA